MRTKIRFVIAVIAATPFLSSIIPSVDDSMELLQLNNYSTVNQTELTQMAIKIRAAKNTDVFDQYFEFMTTHFENGLVRNTLNEKKEGRYTNWGITFHAWKAAKGVNPDDNEIINLTRDEAKVIAKEYYWNRVGLDTINDWRVQVLLFDWVYMSWKSNANRIDDALENIMGKEFKWTYYSDLLGALNEVDDSDALYNELVKQRYEYFDKISEYEYNEGFQEGWRNRTRMIVHEFKY